ncbi:hypothetical protein JDV09_26315, partial [Mycobacterium sp. Y57]|nr:hypothetical protein [Mycolicibacterium xanthum]
LRRTATGLLRIDRAAAQREAHYDGKWLLRTSDLTLRAEDLTAAYKQLLAVERGWRDTKSSLGLRPVNLLVRLECRLRCDGGISIAVGSKQHHFLLILIRCEGFL